MLNNPYRITHLNRQFRHFVEGRLATRAEAYDALKMGQRVRAEVRPSRKNYRAIYKAIARRKGLSSEGAREWLTDAY